MSRCGRKSRGRHAARGVTLVELVVTLAVAAMLAAIAMPSFSSLVRGNRLKSSANEMVAMLQTAKVAAVSRRARVSVCPSADGASCAATAGNRWIALMVKDGVSTVLRDSTLHESVVVKSSANLSAGNHRLVFVPSGFSSVGANASGTIGLCVANLSGNNGIDVTTNVSRVSTRRRAATAACTGPVDN
ncbi:GspH/FimT family pseudopilin [Pseudoxanthomonas sp. LjRoot143]|uniref:GspH/FimT family pseudopilin n=1 Tax=Pseudoxanthomonas sp. LjRoot143 TaxID=3342266 RepID=UPI003ED124EC